MAIWYKFFPFWFVVTIEIWQPCFKGGGGGVGAGMFKRFQRPKSSKYDTYRLRSRTSVVEENLFGEPLKNKVRLRHGDLGSFLKGARQKL
jgi:hypothetical protein